MSASVRAAVPTPGNLGPTHSLDFPLNGSQTFSFKGSHCSHKSNGVDKGTQCLIEEKLARSISLVQRLLPGRGMVGVAGEFLLEVLLPKDVGGTRYEGEDDELEEGSNVDAVRSLDGDDDGSGMHA
jgi:hypothetical protein